MPIVNLDDNEWSQVIAIIANAHPLIAKISTQLVAQKQHAAKGNSDARGQEQRFSEHPETASRGLSAPPSDSDRTK